MIKEPMLAAKYTGEEGVLRFPALISPKVDGIRMFVGSDCICYSRKLKPLPNKHLQATFGRKEFIGLDGEVTMGHPTEADVFRKTSSAVMSIEGEPELTFHVFDDITIDGHFDQRLGSVQTRLQKLSVKVKKELNGVIVPLAHIKAEDEAEMLAMEKVWLGQGYEGLMMRLPNGPYKQGRSTLNEGFLIKVKRFEDGEAIILGYEEEMENTNSAETNELGRTKRSSKKEGMVGKGTLGSLKVVDTKKDKWVFNVGSGFSAAERQELWAKRGSLEGLVIKYRYLAIGMKDLPRHPTFEGFRDPSDF